MTTPPFRESGFTLAESLVVMLIVTILLALAVPSFSDFISRYRLTTASNDFLSGVLLTRNEAMKRGRRVDMVPVTGTDWTSGWIIFIDRNNDQLYTAAAAEDLIAQHPAIPAGIVATGTTNSCSTASAGPAFTPGSRSFVAYLGTGYPASAAGGLMLKQGTNSRIVCINFIGRPRVISSFPN